MSQVIIEFGEVAPSSPGQDSPVLHHAVTSEEITSSGTSQATTASATSDNSIASIVNIGSDVIWVSIGASPTAAVGAKSVIAANERRDFGGLQKGHVVAVINDS